MIAVDLAARYPSLASALVLVDPGPIDPLPATVEFFRAFAKELEGPKGEEARHRYVHDMGARDDELARWIVEHMCVPPQPVAAAVIRGVSEWKEPSFFDTLAAAYARVGQFDEAVRWQRKALDAPDAHEGDAELRKARERLTQMCEKLLANTVIEEYRIEV